MRKYGQAIWNLKLLLMSEGKTGQQASDMVTELAEELNSEDNKCLQEYSVGSPDTLINCINNSSLFWMDATKKSFLINELT